MRERVTTEVTWKHYEQSRTLLPNCAQVFFPGEGVPVSVLDSTYDYRLVALSVVIAILASYAALDLAGLVTATRNKTRLAWLFGGAVALGTGIWAMHYTGMLAYHLQIPIYYHVPTVILSLVAAIFASFIALFTVSRKSFNAIHLLLGSLLMGSGICAMHYTGMASMRLSAMHEWNTGFVTASVVIAVVVSAVALILTFLFREDKPGVGWKIVCAIMMGLAIPAMHYTAMVAVTYTRTNDAPDLTNAVDISALASTSIIIISFVLLASIFLIRRWTITPAPSAAMNSARNQAV
jgi:two-component system, sensor histidine kinase and response regulator